MKRSFLVLFNLILLLFLASCVSSNFDPEKDKKVLLEACEIPPAPETNKEYERDIIRSHAGVITKYYTHESGCPAVESYYEKVLMDRGWEKVTKTFFSYPDSIDYRKEDVTFSIECKETRDLWGIKRFSFSCSKGLD